eukprot:800847-Prorocentrum_minimum.AAC.2
MATWRCNRRKPAAINCATHTGKPATSLSVASRFVSVMHELHIRCPRLHYHYYSNFKDFSESVSEYKQRLMQLMSKFQVRTDPLQVVLVDDGFPHESAETTLQVATKRTAGFDGEDFGEDDEEVLDVLTEIVDHQLDLVDANLEAHKRQDDDGQEVFSALSTGASFESLGGSSAVPPIGSSKKVPFHVANLKRPQDKFEVAPDNSNTPFVLPPPVGEVDKPTRLSNRLSAIEQHAMQSQPTKKRHPLADELLSLHYPPAQLEAATPQLPVELESCPLTMVETVEALQEVVERIRAVKEVRATSTFALSVKPQEFARPMRNISC